MATELEKRLNQMDEEDQIVSPEMTDQSFNEEESAAANPSEGELVDQFLSGQSDVNPFAPQMEMPQQAPIQPPQAPIEQPEQAEKMLASEEPKRPSLEEMLSQYRDLSQTPRLAEAQAKRERLNNLADIMGGLSRIGTSLAYQKPEEKPYEGLRQSGDRAVQEVQEEQKLKQAGLEALQLQQAIVKGQVSNDVLMKMNDANSDISKTARDLTKKRYGINIPEDISAWQLHELGLKMSDPTARASAVKNYLNRGINPATGESEFFQAILTPEGSKINFLGIRPSSVEYLGPDKRTGELVKIDKTTGKITQLTGPKIEKDEQQANQTYYQTHLNPVERKDLDNEIKAYTKETKDNKEALEKFKGLDVKVETAVKNPLAASQIGAEVSKAMGEKGNLSESDVTRYVQNKALAAKITQAWNNWLSGTMSKENAKYLKQALEIHQRVAEDRVEDDARRAVDRYNAKHNKNSEEIYKFFRPDVARIMSSLSDEDKKAVEWARKNQFDSKLGPKARQILKLHGL